MTEQIPIFNVTNWPVMGSHLRCFHLKPNIDIRKTFPPEIVDQIIKPAVNDERMED